MEQGIAGIPTFNINSEKTIGYSIRGFEKAFIKNAPEKPEQQETRAIKICTAESTGTECAQAQKISVQPTTQAIQAQPIEIEYSQEQTKQKIKVSKNGNAITIEDGSRLAALYNCARLARTRMAFFFERVRHCSSGGRVEKSSN